jgi:uncharacterized protein YcaQ
MALTAQGFGGGRRLGAAGRRVDGRHIRAAIDRVAIIQLDSVNVVVRSHELPLYARLGPYPRRRVVEMTERDRELFEYWGHAASLMPVELEPLLRWRMERAREQAWNHVKSIVHERPGLIDEVLAEVASRGPLAASELSMGSGSTGPWWGWGDGKRAMELLFWSGAVAAAGRRPSFERLYDLPERVLPAAVLATPTPTEADAKRALIERSARALGVASVPELADYFRFGQADTKAAVAALEEDGVLEEVQVEGWPSRAWVHRDAELPGSVRAQALLSPLDSLVWHRKRAELLFGTKVRFEVYTPEPERIHGYYVLPFLLGERIVGRVDLKADRKVGTLLVQAAWLEPGHRAERVVPALARELVQFAGWLDLASVTVVGAGDLAVPLASELRRPS